MYANKMEIPPRSNTGLGVVGLDDAVIAWGGSKAVDWVRGGFGREGGEDKAQRALTAGAAAAGPFDEGQLLTAIRTVGASSSSVAELRRRVLEKDWLRGIGIEEDDGRLARAAVFLAHGGKDGELGPSEQRVFEQVGALMQQGGGDTRQTPSEAAASGVTYDPGRTAPPIELGLEYVAATPLWVWVAGGVGLYFLIKR